MLERMMNVVFEDDRVRSRNELMDIFNLPDRQVRRLIRAARRAGIPIMALSDGGYKMARTDSEKRELLAMYRGRAMDELTTYSALRKAMQIEGQIRVTDFCSYEERATEKGEANETDRC